MRLGKKRVPPAHPPEAKHHSHLVVNQNRNPVVQGQDNSVRESTERVVTVGPFVRSEPRAHCWRVNAAAVWGLGGHSGEVGAKARCLEKLLEKATGSVGVLVPQISRSSRTPPEVRCCEDIGVGLGE